MTTEIRVPDASCGHCKSTIETAISALSDEVRADLDLGSKRLVVDHGESVSIAEMTSAIRDAGYTPEPILSR